MQENKALMIKVDPLHIDVAINVDNLTCGKESPGCTNTLAC